MDFTMIDVAIVDYKLPRISGEQLAKHITENSPVTKINMISGYD
jgi:YesN/AraC family two-component response regulator